MKVLLDEQLPHDVRHEIVGHDVFTVQYAGWKGLKNGRLMAAAAAAGFDVLLTMDRGIRHQQNLGSLPLSVLLINAASNDMNDLQPLVPRILIALNHLQPNSFDEVT